MLTVSLPFPFLEAAFDQGRSAFCKVLGDILALFAPYDAVDKQRLLFHAVAGLILCRTCQAYRADRSSLRCVPQFRVFGKIADYYALVIHLGLAYDRRFSLLFFLFLLFGLCSQSFFKMLDLLDPKF